MCLDRTLAAPKPMLARQGSMRAGTSSSKHARCVQYMIVLRIYPAGLALPGNQVSTQDLLPRRRAAACRLQEAEREIAA
eukprot:CAMPEP_0206138318 /NCGR_PEP_ID=MMETSP1473-20131121/3232_1 /ASSEMBLY_ACC=CAM_ASM_001109 /TAXON_ID=1461547 /ORGANISM="Stichococcus sp, Strain RCC1054" /LENGTH=78 /DNA_ID=CAMNT_0053531709 /DNA_START=221 /DNA_END=454 /DNA_ORIENTATION=+